MRRAERLQRIDRVVCTALPVAVTAFTVLIIAAAGQKWWIYVTREDSPTAWLQNMLLFACGLLCLATLAVGYLRGKAEWGWALLSAGFFWLMLDDRFALHERLRDQLLVPLGVGALLPGLGAGDFLLLLYLAVGVAAAPVWLRLWRGHRRATNLFLAGAALAAVATLADAIDFERLTLQAQIVEQFTEELCETAATVLFVLGLLRRWLEELDGLLGQE